MHRNSRSTAVLCVVLALAVVLGGPVGRAAADGEPVYGTTSGVLNFGASDEFGVLPWLAEKAGWWVSCDIAGYWKRYPTGVTELRIVGGCRRGWSMNDGDLKVWADVPSCGRMEASPGNIDSPSETGSFDVLMGAGTSCGMPTILCASVDGEGEVCKAWNVGAPPGEVPAGETSGGGCPLGTLMKPYVTAWTTTGSSGSWRWQQTVTLRAFAQSPGALTINGTTAILSGFVSYQSGTAISLVSSAPDQRRDSAGTSIFTSFRYAQSGTATPSATDSVVLTIQGPLQTGAVGSQASPTLKAAGYYPSPTWATTAGSTASEGGWPTPLTAAQWNALSGSSYRNASQYAGHTKLSWCYAAWGNPVQDNGEAVPMGTLPTQPAGTTAPPYVAPRTTPPVIYVGPETGCPAGADRCIDPDANAPEQPPAIPDPEDDSCNFSITDPATWGGQLICVIVAVAKGIMGMLGDLLGLLGGLVDALLDGLLALLVPDGDHLAAELDGVKEAWSTNTLGNWLTAFTSSAPTAPSGGCSGPHVSFPVLDSTFESDPLNACSGAAATFAGYCRAFLTAIIVFFGALAGLRVLGRGFGWSPAVGGGDGQ
ncbi:hypothetical protein [Nocardioides sp. LML1-1-1.1]|uniref:hypothetical protein n=1 Tax=Nocardioides sp. LML1-1-1.1 TaxID=3135248 RepID=UPI0034264976